MKPFLTFFLSLLVVSLTRADQLSKFQGSGDWGITTQGISCRATPDKSEYALGEPVRVLIEVRNETDKPIALGLEPLIEVPKEEGRLFRQPAMIVLAFSQGDTGFFSTYYISFPKGNQLEVVSTPDSCFAKGKEEARAVVIEPKATFSEIITRTPWGPTYGCIHSTADPGTMTLNVSLRQFLSPDLKQATVDSPTVTFTAKGPRKAFELGSATNGSQPIRSETNRTSSAADSRR